MIDLRNHVISAAVERYGFSYEDAENQVDALMSGNHGEYTSRIRRVIEAMNRDLCGND